MSQVMALSFKDVQFDVIDQRGQPWLQGKQIGQALGYKNPRQAVSFIYERNKEEFTQKMVGVIKLNTPSGIQEVRIFSLRGAHLIAMFARTNVAKDFRKWVLDVLDKYVNGTAEPKMPVTSPSTPADRKPLRDVVNVWSRLSGVEHSDAWKQVRAAFNLNNIKEMPREWIPDACAWVQEKIDALPKAVPGPEQEKELPAATNNSRYYDEIFSNIYQTGLEFCGKIQKEAEKAIGERPRFLISQSNDLESFYYVHQRQIIEGTEFLMRGVNIIMRSVESIKYVERIRNRS